MPEDSYFEIRNPLTGSEAVTVAVSRVRIPEAFGSNLGSEHRMT
jgi:hypothetical protein